MFVSAAARLTIQRCPGGLCSRAEHIDQLSGMYRPRAGITSELKQGDRDNDNSSLSSVWWPARLIGAGGKLRLASTRLIYVIMLLWESVYEVVMFDLDPDSRAFHIWKSKEADISHVLYILNAISNLSAAYSVVMLPQSVLLPCGRYQRWITIWFFVVTFVLGFAGYLRNVGVIDTGIDYCASDCPTLERSLYAWLCHKNSTLVAAFMDPEVSKEVLAITCYQQLASLVFWPKRPLIE